MAYDQAGWHSGGNFPEGMPDENGGTHIGMFLAWAIINDLAGSTHQEHQVYLEDVKARRLTGRDFLFQLCDGKFWKDDLSDEGNRFAACYYDTKYIDDYNDALGQAHPTLYHVENTWENFDKIAPVISKRFEQWRRTGSIEAPWWKFW